MILMCLLVFIGLFTNVRERKTSKSMFPCPFPLACRTRHFRSNTLPLLLQKLILCLLSLNIPASSSEPSQLMDKKKPITRFLLFNLPTQEQSKSKIPVSSRNTCLEWAQELSQ